MGENGHMRSIGVVALGGAVGASLRWGVGQLIEPRTDGFPWATFIVNVVGCVAIGFAARRVPRNSDAWLGLVVGVLGGLTTFSAFAVETRSLLDSGHAATAAAYVVATLVVGLGATELTMGGHDR
jgi:fluoride exporter